MKYRCRYNDFPSTFKLKKVFLYRYAAVDWRIVVKMFGALRSFKSNVEHLISYRLSTRLKFWVPRRRSVTRLYLYSCIRLSFFFIDITYQ